MIKRALIKTTWGGARDLELRSCVSGSRHRAQSSTSSRPLGDAPGYLLKKTPPARLLESLKEAVDGGAPMSPEVARRVIALFREIRPPDGADYHLTPHEVRLLKLLVEGHNYKTAAADLNVSVNTIRFHMRSIYDKLQVHSKSEAVAKALRHRIVR